MKYTSISFPSFGLEFDPIRVIELGPLTIHLYGLIIACGLMLAVVYACKRCAKFGLNEDQILDGVLWVTPFAFACARLYYCLFSWERYAHDPISILYVWEGGLAIYGGVLGAIVGVIVYCRLKRVSLPAVLDLVSLGFLIGQSVGRWGNFFNREAFGSETEGLLRMGLFNTHTQSWEYHHPTFLYESLWNALGFVLLHQMSKHRKFDGQIALGYVVWYGAGRAVIEGLRTDSLYIGSTGIRVSQLLAGVSCVLAAVALMWLSRKEHDPEKLYVNQTNKNTEGEEHHE